MIHGTVRINGVTSPVSYSCASDYAQSFSVERDAGNVSHLIVDLWCSNGAKFADLLRLEMGMVRVEPAVRRTDPVK